MSNGRLIKAVENSIIDLHKKAQEYHIRKAKLSKTNIKYGRSPSLSSYFEERFVEELSKIYSNYFYYIDYPIRLYDLKRRPLSSQNIYPDVMIIDKNNRLKAIIELKTDIGHLDIDQFKQSKREKLLIQAKFATTNSIVGRYSDQKDKLGKKTIDLSKKYLKIILVITLMNQHSYEGYPKSKEYKKAAKKLGYRTLFLLEKYHYNYYDDKTKEIKSEIQLKKREIIKTFNGL